MKNYRVFALFSISMLIFPAFSCSTEGALQHILGTSAEPPVFIECRSVSSTQMVFKFSQPVNVVSCYFDPPLEIKSIEGGDEVTVVFAKKLEEGKRVTADLVVEDPGMNTLNVIVPFRTRNDRMPRLLFNELRTENSKPKSEFVEFLSQGAGNLGGMRLFIAGHSLTAPVYEFSPTEVKAGEYIVLHLRTTEEGCQDETGADLALSAGTDAQNDARDLWVPGNTKLLHKTDALWLVDQDDKIIDAILLSENPDAKWANDKIAEAANLLGGKKAWLPSSGDAVEWSPGPSDAVIVTGTTATRTICRDETPPAKPCASNWYITATSSATPGKPNNPKRYTK